MQKFIRHVMGTNNIDCCARVCHSPTAWGMQKSFGTGAATNSYEDIEHTRCIMVIGANPTEGHPVTGARLNPDFRPPGRAPEKLTKTGSNQGFKPCSEGPFGLWKPPRFGAVPGRYFSNCSIAVPLME